MNSWSLLTSKGCFHSANIEIRLPSITRYFPNRKSNPRAFIEVNANEIIGDSKLLVVR